MLQTLPNEILHMICACLDEQEDIPYFRLVSQRFTSIGLEHLIPKGNFYLRRASLARLETIATHPVLSSNLREVTILADIFPDFESSSEWRKQALDFCRWVPGTDVVDEEMAFIAETSP